MNANIESGLISAIDGVALGLYGLSWVVFLRAFIVGRQEPTRATVATLWAAFAVHSAALAARWFSAGHVPIIGTYGAMSFIAWSAALCFIFLQSHLRSSSLGVFILPFVIIFAGTAWAFIGIKKVDEELAARIQEQGMLFAAHMATALFSYSCFAIAFAGGLMYVLQDREIHGKHMGFFFRRMPSLDKIDKINTHAMGLGLISLGVGIVSGAAGLAAAHAALAGGDMAKIITAVIVWLAYAASLTMIMEGGWRGRRGAIASIACFCMVFVLYFVVLQFAHWHGIR